MNQLAQNITNFFIAKNVIKITERDIYVYGFELMLSGIVSAVMILFVGAVFHEFFHAVIFLFIMIPVRMFTGGYHADTHFTCNVVFLLAFLISVVFLQITIHMELDVVVWVMVCVGLILVARYAPLENKNKRLSDIEKLKYRKIGIGMYTGCIVVSGIMNIISHVSMRIQYNIFREFGFYINIVLIIIAGMLMIGVRKEGNSCQK